jgi:cation diffusion facilitator CzcD-associated flavoprotein CzcO
MREWTVVGAGPSGLAAAAALKERGADPLVLEAGPALGTAWRERRYDRLRLHTVRSLSGLPGLAIPKAYGRWVARDDFVAYLDDYARRFGLEPRVRSNVRRIEREGGAWRLELADGQLTSRRVVVATGFSNLPWLPDWPGRETFAGELLHSADYRSAEPFRGREVLVVGTGNSGAEIAVDLAEGGASRVRLAVRTPPNIVRRQRFGVPAQLVGIVFGKLPLRTRDPLGRLFRRLSVPDLAPYGLPAPRAGFTQLVRTGTVPIVDVGLVDAVRAGRVEVVAAVERLAGERVLLADGAAVTPDVVVAATGFRPGLEPLVGHLGVLDERGLPVVHGAATHPAAPGLHFAGIELTLAGLLRTAARDARAVAAAA